MSSDPRPREQSVRDQGAGAGRADVEHRPDSEDHVSRTTEEQAADMDYEGDTPR